MSSLRNFRGNLYIVERLASGTAPLHPSLLSGCWQTGALGQAHGCQITDPTTVNMPLRMLCSTGSVHLCKTPQRGQIMCRSSIPTIHDLHLSWQTYTVDIYLVVPILYDLYDLAHVAGWELYSLRDLQ